MRQEKWIKLEELRAPGTRRVFEAVRMVSGEMLDFDDDDIPNHARRRVDEEPPGWWRPAMGVNAMETLLLSALGLSTALALLAVAMTSDDGPDGFSNA